MDLFTECEGLIIHTEIKYVTELEPRRIFDFKKPIKFFSNREHFYVK